MKYRSDEHGKQVENHWEDAKRLSLSFTKDGNKISRDKLQALLGVSDSVARTLYDGLRYRSLFCKGDMTGEIRAEAVAKEKTRDMKAAKKHIDRLIRQVELHTTLGVAKLEPPKWTVPAAPKKSEVITCSILSDTHFDETVVPEEVNFCNEYNREIATVRLRKYFENLILIDRDYVAGVHSVGLVLAMAGDMVTGNIHEELTQTNSAPLTDTVFYWSEQLAAGLSLVLEHFKRVWVHCVVGNHGRLTPKVKFKGAVMENWDWLLYNLVARYFSDNKHVKFHIPLATQTTFPVYDTVYGLHHGMDFRGGHGDAGAVVPMIRGNRRKREFQTQIKQPYDVLLTAHFHQAMRLPTVISNGSMIGYNEFAMRGSFPFEPPQQVCWLTDPVYGHRQPFFPVFC